MLFKDYKTTMIIKELKKLIKIALNYGYNKKSIHVWPLPTSGQVNKPVSHSNTHAKVQEK